MESTDYAWAIKSFASSWLCLVFGFLLVVVGGNRLYNNIYLVVWIVAFLFLCAFWVGGWLWRVWQAVLNDWFCVLSVCVGGNGLLLSP